MTTMLPEPSFGLATLVSILAVGLGGAGVVCCVLVLRARGARLASERDVDLGVVALPARAFYKLAAFAGLLVLPLATAFVANYHVFEGSTEVSGCASCHTMTPMVVDMTDPGSQTLAAMHYRNRWIAERQCETCHADYGFQGSLEAKLTGYRHLARYVTETYAWPIEFKGRYVNRNCLRCHGGTPRFDAVSSHHTVWDRLVDNRLVCLNCHGNAHPTRAARTPGSAEYARLMGEAP